MVIMEITTLKLISTFAILLVALAGGALPVIRARSKFDKKSKFLTYGNAFSGGVLLGAALLHLLPEAIEGWQDLYPNSTYPWIELLVASGVLLVLFVEKVLVGCEHHALHEVVEERGGRSIYAYTLAIVLSLHSYITGMALGTQETIKGTAIVLLAILAHKAAGAFALGVSMVFSTLKRRTIWAILLIFSLTTPLGIATGMFLIDEFSSSTKILECIFNALATGTFLYIATIDVIVEEFREKTSVFKFLLLICGIALMAGVAVWV